MEMEELLNTMETELKSCTRTILKRIVRHHLDIFRVDEIKYFKDAITRRGEPMIIKDMQPYV